MLVVVLGMLFKFLWLQFLEYFVYYFFLMLGLENGAI